MKNFPDHNSFEKLGKRLETYTEQPDDLIWNNIDAALRPDRTPGWIIWVNRISTTTSIILLSMIVGVEVTSISPEATIASKENFTPNHKQKELAITVPGQHGVDGLTEKTKVKRPSLFTNKMFSFKRSNIDTQTTRSTREEIFLPTFLDTATSVYSDKKSEPLAFENKKSDTIFIDSKTLKVDSFKTEDNTSKEQKIRKRGLTFYFSAMPQLSFQQVIPASHDGIIITDIYNQPIFSSERLGISVEAGIQGKLARRMEYYAGVSVFQQRQTLRYEYQVTSHPNIQSIDNLNYSITPDTQIGTINYAMLNVGANAGLLYHLSGGKLAHKIGAGLSYQYGSRKMESEVYDNASSQYLFYQLHYRTELQVSSGLSFFIQPTFSQSVFANQKLEAPFKLKPYRAGLGIGILFRLK